MRKVMTSGVLLVILFVSVVIGLLIWNNKYYKKVEIPQIYSSSNDYGTKIAEDSQKDNYEVYTEKYEATSTIAQNVNKVIEDRLKKFIDSIDKDEVATPSQKAVFKNIIDSYKVNDNIVSFKVTILEKELKKEGFKKNIITLNYDLSKEEKITLDSLFKDGFKEKIKDQYSESYILKAQDIVFYDGDYESSIAYSKLKDYNKTKLLTAKNYNMTEEEYKKISNVVDPSKKMVAITFDDGPHATNTYKILEILEKNNAKATFFMLGQNVTYYPEVVKAVYNSGSEIGIHSWSHPDLTKLESAKILEEIQNTSDKVYGLTGYRPKLVRPPYGALNSVVKSTISLPFILWNIDSLDWKSRDEKQIVPLVMNDVEDGDIILLHDIHSTTVPAAEKIISQLVEQDYQLVTVSEMLEAKGYDTTVTKVFYSGRQ